MFHYEWYIAKRLFWQCGNDRRASRSAIFIAMLGVSIGVAVMIIAISVVLGFKHEVQAKVTGIGNHIQVLNYATLYSTEPQPIAFLDSLRDALPYSIFTYCQKSGMLKTDESFQGVVFRGIGEDYDLGFLRQNITAGSIQTPFSSTEETGRLVLSQRLANQLQLKVGCKVYAYFFDRGLRARRFRVEAIYATNLSEYDSRLVFCDKKVCQQLLGYKPDQVSGGEINVGSLDRLDEVQAHVLEVLANIRQDCYGGYYTARTIKEMYPHIFAWLDLLDLNVMVILLLMMAVAGFTAISGLLIIILERTQFIGVMKALGSTNASLRHLFIYYAVQIVTRGMLYGNLLGIGFCLLQQHFGFIHLDASSYYVPVAPILISWPMVVIVNLVTFLVTTLAMVLPSFVVSNIHPARSIRFE